MIGWLRRMLSGADEPAEWAIATGAENGHPVILRTRTRPPRGMPNEDHPDTVEIIWRFDPAVQSGMPTPELSSDMSQREDVLGTLRELLAQSGDRHPVEVRISAQRASAKP